MRTEDIDLTTLPMETRVGSGIRLDLVEHLELSLRKLTGSDADFDDVIRDIGGINDPYREVADRRFRRREDGTYWSDRYNAPDFPAFYLAGEDETAIQESAHARLPDLMKLKQPITLEVTNWEISGTERSLLPFTSTHPELTGVDYSYCQRIGRQATRGAAQTLTVPSARQAGGSNCVIFFRPVVRSLGPTGRRIRLQLNNSTGAVEIVP